MEIVGSDELLACVGFALSSVASGPTVRCRRLKSLQDGVKERGYKLNLADSAFQDLVENFRVLLQQLPEANSHPRTLARNTRREFPALIEHCDRDAFRR
jgi:hypothetical protein